MFQTRLVAIAVCFATALSAQTNRGAITGTVFDPAGAVVPGASVTVVNIGTNQKFVEKTSGAGSYTVQSLDPVQYRIDVDAAGFKRTVVDKIKVDTASTATVDVRLETGTLASTVTVEAEAATINTENGSLSSTITAREIQDAPLVNRSVLDLAMTLPNVGGDAGSEDPVITSVTPCPGCNLSVGGGRPMSTLMLADGANNTGVSLGRTMTSFSPETVQEFTVLTSAFSAEYGQSGGGVINVTTKSGTNSWREHFSGTIGIPISPPRRSHSPQQTARSRPSSTTSFPPQRAVPCGSPRSTTARTRPSSSVPSNPNTAATTWTSTACCPPTECETAISAAW